MIRKEAIPLIESAISSGVWRNYRNPTVAKYAFNFPDSLLEHFAEKFPDVMDRMQFAARMAWEYVENCPVELIKVPTHATADMGQVEIILQHFPKVRPCVVFYKGAFFIREEPFFPF